MLRTLAGTGFAPDNYDFVTILVWAAITKYRLGGLNNRNVFLTALEAGRSEVRVPAWSGPGGGSLLGLLVAVFLLHAHRMVREHALFSLS